MGRRNCTDYCLKFAKITVIGVNALFFFLGLGVVIAGAVLSSRAKDLQNQSQILEDLNVIMIALIVAVSGAAVVAASVCGLVGAWKQNRKCLIAYAASLFVIIAVQIAMGAYLASLGDSALYTQWRNSSPDGRDEVQRYLGCCGWFQVWDTVPYPDCQGVGAPVSTCHDKAVQYINDNIKPVAITALVIGCLELLTLSSTCCLIFKSKDLGTGDDAW